MDQKATILSDFEQISGLSESKSTQIYMFLHLDSPNPSKIV